MLKINHLELKLGEQTWQQLFTMLLPTSTH